uniref:J domain-containing protein n=1 Tax=Strongyloides papillosus TaxID=174720 RepID=A0A0N5BIT7_STREA
MGDSMDYCPYNILSLTKECTEGDIKKAYKKAALKWHPDKNPSRKEEAQKMFLKIQEASTLLLDVDAKAAYDNMILAKENKIKNLNQRRKEESDVRKKFREDLEARENEFNKTIEEKNKEAEERLKKELNKLKSKSWKIKIDLDELINKELDKEKEYLRKMEIKYKPQLKVRWKYNNFDYTEDILYDIFKKHGTVLGVVCSGNNTAIVEFSNLKEAIIAEDETGIEMNPLKVSWVNLRPEHLDYVKDVSSEDQERSNVLNFKNIENISPKNFLKLEDEVMADLLGDNWKKEYDVIDELIN